MEYWKSPFSVWPLWQKLFSFMKLSPNTQLSYLFIWKCSLLFLGLFQLKPTSSDIRIITPAVYGVAFLDRLTLRMTFSFLKSFLDNWVSGRLQVVGSCFLIQLGSLHSFLISCILLHLKLLLRMGLLFFMLLSWILDYSKWRNGTKPYGFIILYFLNVQTMWTAPSSLCFCNSPAITDHYLEWKSK